MRVAIIGGGATGVSTFYALIQKAEAANLQKPFHITIYEKSGRIGRGLAYETKLPGHILNMPAKTMSAVACEPDHFLKWLQNSGHLQFLAHFNSHSVADEFIPRHIFGSYLEDLYQKTKSKAAQLGIKISEASETVIDARDDKDQIIVASESGEKQFDQIILCLGNHPPSYASRFKGQNGYFHEPWPEHAIMEHVPNDAPVAILGSSLTALDAFVSLQEKGHRGPVTFASRHGILPKVRVLAEPYNLHYLSPENIQALTLWGARKLSLSQMRKLFFMEMKKAGADIPYLKRSFLQSDMSPADDLNADIQRAQNGNMRHFNVLKAMDEVAGLLWNALRPSAQGCFDRYFKSFWNALDYPMPMQNALKLMRAFEGGALNVCGGFQTITQNQHTGTFHLSFETEQEGKSEKSVAYVINATGQDLRVSGIPSPLIQNLITRNLASDHRAGGFDVEYHSGALRGSDGNISQNIFAVGGLTRGVHFYTNSINENAKCAMRTAQAIINAQTLNYESTNIMTATFKTPSRHVALFIGSDISSHILLNSLIPELQKRGFEPFVYFTKHLASKKPVLSEIAEQGFYERTMLSDHIYPFLDQFGISSNAPCVSPLQIARKYGISVVQNQDVNDPAFLDTLQTQNIHAGIVIRSYQKFGKDIIHYFQDRPNGALWNLHPGILPHYRGVMTYFRSMDEGQDKAGYSLHVMDENWDSGPVIDIHPMPLDLKKPMLNNYCDIAPSGISMIVDNLEKLVRGQTPGALPQNPEESRYFTFPHSEEMNTFLSKGLRLVDAVQMKAIYLNRFSHPYTYHETALSDVIDRAIYQKFGIWLGSQAQHCHTDFDM